MKKKALEKPLAGEASLFSETEDVYPDAVVKISRDQYSIFELKRMAEDTGELIVDPEFQRNPVWSPEQERELMGSVLMGIPVPVIYVFENPDGRKQVVDGRQRISAMIRFLNNAFSLENLKMLPRFNGNRFRKLDPIYQSKVERYQLSVYVIEPPTPELVKYDIFDRVNRGGTQLNNQEMRNALYMGEATRLLKRISLSKAFKKATGNGIDPKRMRDQYVIVRFLAFYLLRSGSIKFTYKSNMDDFLAEVMKHLNDAVAEELARLERICIEALQACHRVLGPDGFRFAVVQANRRPINMLLFEVLVYFCVIKHVQNCDTDMLKEKLNRLKEEFDSSGFFKSRVDSSLNVEYRFETIENLAKGLPC